MASLKSFRDALKSALAADAELSSWATTWFQRPLTVLGDMQAGPIQDEEKPAVAIGRGRTVGPDEPTVGNLKAEKAIDLPFEVIWSEPDPLRANDQHSELHDILSRVVLRNRGMGGAHVVGLVEGAAGETQQPMQAYSGAIRAEYEVTP
jgi:hypothetical protein